jgi:hypothetical protein
VIYFKNIKIHIFSKRKENKNEDNLIININFNYEYIINVKKKQSRTIVLLNYVIFCVTMKIERKL